MDTDRTTVALYAELDNARAAVDALLASGVEPARLRIFAPGEDVRAPAAPHAPEAGERAALAGEGAGYGGLAGLVAGVVLLSIPGVGALAALGFGGALAASAGAGAATGAIVGALLGRKPAEGEEEDYIDGLRRGGTLVAVRTYPEQVDHVIGVLARFDPIEISRRDDFAEPEPVVGPTPDDAAGLTAAKAVDHGEASWHDRRSRVRTLHLDDPGAAYPQGQSIPSNDHFVR